MGSVQWMKSRAAIAAIGLIPATVILASACSSGPGLGNKAGPLISMRARTFTARPKFSISCSA